MFARTKIVIRNDLMILIPSGNNIIYENYESHRLRSARARARIQQGQQKRDAENLPHGFYGFDDRNKFVKYAVPEEFAKKEQSGEKE